MKELSIAKIIVSLGTTVEWLVLNNKDVTVVLTDGPTTTTTDNDEHSSRLKNNVDRLSSQVKKAPMEHRRVITAQKRTSSWAEIARNGIRQ